MTRPITDPARKETKPPDFVQRGKVLIVRRQFQEAVKVCRLGLLAHPTYVEGRLVLGMALMALSRHDEVLAEVRVALELDPDNPMAYLLKGEALLHKRDFAQAREVLEKAQELDPLNVKARNLLEEIDEVVDYGPDSSPRARTVTKVYPAQRAQALSTLHPDPSEAIANARFQEWDQGDEAPVEGGRDSTAVSDLPVTAGEAPGSGRAATPSAPLPAAPPIAGKPSEESERIEVGDQDIEEEDEYTTAPFLAPTHMVAKRRGAAPEWDEQTVSEEEPQAVSPDDTATAHRLEEDDEPPEAERRPDTELRSDASSEWDVSDIQLETVREPKEELDEPTEASPPRRVKTAVAAEEPTAAVSRRPRVESAADDPTVDSISVRSKAPVAEDPLEEPTDVPGRARHLAAERLPPPPGEEPEELEELEEEDAEDLETVVNADAPPPEALFGEDADEPRAPATTPRPSGLRPPTPRPRTGARSSADPTKAVSLNDASAELEAPLARAPSLPHISQVRYVSGVEVQPSIEGGTGEVEVEDEDLEQEHPYVSDEPSYSELSDISIEMIPDDLPMPPLPPDARGRPEPDEPSLFGLEAPIRPETSEVDLGRPSLPPGAPPLPASTEGGELEEEAEEEEEEEEHATRVNFDALPDEEPAVFPAPSLDFQPADSLQRSPPDLDYPEPEDYGSPAEPAYSDGEAFGEEPEPEPEPVRAGIIREPVAPRLSDGVGFAPASEYDDGRYEESIPGAKVVDLPPPEDFSFEPSPAYQPRTPPPAFRPKTPAPAPAYRPQTPVPVRRSRPPGPAAMPSRPDADELAVEPADSWSAPPSPSRTASIEEDSGEHPYADQGHDDRTSETAPGGPKGIRGGARDPEPRRAFGDGVIDEAGSSGLFKQRAATQVPEAKRLRDRAREQRRRPHPRDRTSTTSFLTLLMGEPGSHRGLFLLLGALGVLLAAVGIGLAVRYFRRGELIDTLRKQAVTRLQQGNFSDFNAATENLQQVLKFRPNDREVFWALARTQTAIPVEFGDLSPFNETAGEGESYPEWVAAEVYSKLQGGSLEKAVPVLERSRRQHGGTALWHYLSGRVRLLEGNAVEAERFFSTATKLEPKDTLALRWLGESIAAQGRATEAMKVYEQALAINPDHVGTLLSRARLAVEMRQALNQVRIELASITQGRLAQKDLSSRGQRGWAHLLLAQLALKEGRLDLAKPAVLQAKTNQPKDVTFLDAMASTLIALGDIGGAETTVRESKSLMPGRPQPSYYMALIYQLNGKPNDGLRELDDAQRKWKFADASVLRATLYLEQRRYRLAEREAQKALDSSDLPDAHVVMARVDAAEGRQTEAVDRLQRQLGKHPKNPRLLAALGEVYLGWRKLTEARSRLKDALEIDPYAIDARINLARVYEAAGNYKAAKEALEEATRKNLGNIVAQRELARILLESGELNEAAAVLQAAIQRAPNDAQARLALVRVYTAQRKFDDADRELRHSATLTNPPEVSSAALAAGRLTLARGDAAAAVEKLRQAAHALREKSFEPWDLLLRAYLESRDDEPAKRTVREIDQLFSGTPEAFLAQGRLHYHQGQLPAAISKLRNAVQALDGQHRRPPVIHSEILVLLGQALQDASRTQEADVKYREATEKCRSCADPLFRRARILDDNKQTREAIDLLLRAALLDPNKFEIQYELGQIYERDDVEKARQAYRKCLTLNPPTELRESVQHALESLNNR